MTDTIIRPYRHETDKKAVQRSWIEIGWIEDDANAKQMLNHFVLASSAWVAEFNGEAECLAVTAEGDLRYLDETLSFGAVTAVTNSIIVRKQGLASRVTARAIAEDAAAGRLVSGLGIFEQGFYNRLGFGNGSYENYVTFDPADLTVDVRFRPPRRLDKDDWLILHQARLRRLRPHGSISLYHPHLSRVELEWEDNVFGLGYFDGPDETLSHYVLLNAHDDKEHGPYDVWWMSYESYDQFLELLALLKSLGDQIANIGMEEPAGIQLQDFMRQPFKSRRVTRRGGYETGIRARAYWQMRVNDIAGCLAKTRLQGVDLRFNLVVDDPIGRYLDDAAPWRGTSGTYIVQLGPDSAAQPGRDPDLPTLKTTINAFTRLWLGIRPATGLAVTDALEAPPLLLKQLDHAFCLPQPKPDWEF